MFCPNCGTKTEAGMSFCEECGCALMDDVNTSVSEPQTNNYQQNFVENFEPAFVNIPQPPEKPERSKKGLVVGVVVSVVVLLVAVVAALFISGVVDLDFSKKETTTQSEGKKKQKETTTEESTEEITEEETTEETTTEVDVNAEPKKNLVGTWKINLECDYEPIYGSQYRMTMPGLITFYDNGTYKLYFDEGARDVMFYEMIDEYLNEDGYFDMDDEQKAVYLADFDVDDEQELYSLLYGVFLENIPESDCEELIESIPLPQKGYWAVNGDYLYLTDDASQITSFNANPNAYKYDCIKTNLTKGTGKITVTDDYEYFTFVKK